jgi:hypothetical protein
VRAPRPVRAMGPSAVALITGSAPVAFASHPQSLA